MFWVSVSSRLPVSINTSDVACTNGCSRFGRPANGVLLPHVACRALGLSQNWAATRHSPQLPLPALCCQSLRVSESSALRGVHEDCFWMPCWQQVLKSWKDSDFRTLSVKAWQGDHGLARPFSYASCFSLPMASSRMRYAQ